MHKFGSLASLSQALADPATGGRDHTPTRPPLAGAEKEPLPSDRSPGPLCCLPETEAVLTIFTFRPVLLFFSYKKTVKYFLHSWLYQK